MSLFESIAVFWTKQNKIKFKLTFAAKLDNFIKTNHNFKKVSLVFFFSVKLLFFFILTTASSVYFDIRAFFLNYASELMQLNTYMLKTTSWDIMYKISRSLEPAGDHNSWRFVHKITVARP